MHRHLDHQAKKVKDLEETINKFKSLCTESLEDELIRLERRKKDLLMELDETEAAILDRKTRLEVIKEEINTIIGKDIENDDRNECIHDNESNNINSPQRGYAQTMNEAKARALEEKYMEETDLLLQVKDIGQDVLFIVHRNNIPDIIIYSPSSHDVEVVSVLKLPDIDIPSSLVSLTSFEVMMAYGAKIIPNHEREYPHVKELVVPFTLRKAWKNKIKKSNSNSNDKDIDKNDIVNGNMGQLMGAFEIPLTPDVVIDVWFDPDTCMYWATTSIDSVSFSLLERMYVTTETTWGVPTVVQVDLFGRHPIKGHMLLESVTASQE